MESQHSYNTRSKKTITEEEAAKILLSLKYATNAVAGMKCFSDYTRQ